MATAPSPSSSSSSTNPSSSLHRQQQQRPQQNHAVPQQQNDSSSSDGERSPSIVDSSPEVEVPPHHPSFGQPHHQRNMVEAGARNEPLGASGPSSDPEVDQGPVNERPNRQSSTLSNKMSRTYSSSSISSSASSMASAMSPPPPNGSSNPCSSCDATGTSSRPSNIDRNLLLPSTSTISTNSNNNPRSNPLSGSTSSTSDRPTRPVSASSSSGTRGQGQQNDNNNQEPLFNWQASKCCVKDRLSAIFNRETLADVHFILGRGDHVTRIPAHKFVLSIGSAVFDAMFNGGMATTDEEIELPDVEPSAFLSLLKFLYTDDVNIGPETVMQTLYTAKKYAVPTLENLCVEFLKQNLSSENAFMLLSQARLFDETTLAQTCLESIDKNTVGASEAEGFLDIDHETLCAVLERDTLRIREVVLFNAVIRWAEAECIRQGLPNTPTNQRSLLGRALYLIRFPLMNIEEFASEVAQSGILTDREVVNLFLYFTVNPKPTIEFPDVPRSPITSKEYVLSRFSKTESRWGYSGTSDRIRFKVDRKIFLVGFGLYGSIHGSSQYDVTIEIVQTTTGKVLGKNQTNFTCDGSSHTFRVAFKHPIEIQPNITYTACATLKGPDSHYGTEGRRKVIIDLQGGKRVAFEFQYAAGCNNGTSVDDGQIPEFIFYT